MIRQLRTAFFRLPLTTRRYIIFAVAVSVICVAIGVLGYFVLDAISERRSHAKTQKALTTAENNIKALIVERDTARINAATARGQALELQNQLDDLSGLVTQSETHLTNARSSTKEVKAKYDKTKQTTTISDDRSSAVKREELRTRYAERGIVVTER